MSIKIKLTLTKEINGEQVGEPRFAIYETDWYKEIPWLNSRQEYLFIVNRLMELLMDALKKSEG